MEIVTSLSRKELELLIESAVNKGLESKLASPSEPTTPDDRCGLNEACIIIGTPGKPASKAQVYKLTSENKVPHQKYLNRLVFSRRALNAWVAANTRTPEPSPAELAVKKLTKEARRHEQK